MDQDRQRSRRLTDEELASLRRERFGELPARVVPDDMIETTKPGPPGDEPPEPLFRQEWGAG